MKNCLLLIIFTLASINVMAAEDRGDARELLEPKGYLYGFGLGVSQEIYKGYNYRVIPLPIIGYRGDKFNVLGPFVSYEALEFSDFELTVQAAPRFQGFKDSDSYIFENMDERKFSMDAGVGLTYEKNNWKVNVSSMFDILGKSKGYETKAVVSRVFAHGAFFFEPSASVSYLDSNHVDYYYGVKAHEVNFHTRQYQGDSTINTTLSLSVSTPLFFGGFTQVGVDYNMFGSEISDSPLVDSDTNLNMRILFSKFF